MIQQALSATVTVGIQTAGEAASLVLDNTVGRLLDTNPDKVR